MRRWLAAAGGALLLIISAHRLLAPIVEESPKPKRIRQSATESATRSFAGIWKGTVNGTNNLGNQFSNFIELHISKDGMKVDEWKNGKLDFPYYDVRRRGDTLTWCLGCQIMSYPIVKYTFTLIGNNAARFTTTVTTRAGMSKGQATLQRQ